MIAKLKRTENYFLFGKGKQYSHFEQEAVKSFKLKNFLPYDGLQLFSLWFIIHLKDLQIKRVPLHIPLEGINIP